MGLRDRLNTALGLVGLGDVVYNRIVTHDAAITAVNAIRNVSFGLADGANTLVSAAAVDQATADTRATEIKTNHNLHVALTTIHLAAGPAGQQVTAANGDGTVGVLVTLCEDIRTKVLAHWASTGSHVTADARTIAAATVTNLATALTFLNEVFTDENAHYADTIVHQDMTKRAAAPAVVAPTVTLPD